MKMLGVREGAGERDLDSGRLPQEQIEGWSRAFWGASFLTRHRLKLGQLGCSSRRVYNRPYAIRCNL